MQWKNGQDLLWYPVKGAILIVLVGFPCGRANCSFSRGDAFTRTPTAGPQRHMTTRKVYRAHALPLPLTVGSKMWIWQACCVKLRTRFSNSSLPSEPTEYTTHSSGPPKSSYLEVHWP